MNLIKHFLETNSDEVVAGTYMNCHARGLHSIMLLNRPGGIIRLFVTDPNHELWMNDPRSSSQELSLGYHGHRTGLVLESVVGCFINHRLQYFGGNLGKPLNVYRYSSAIADKEAGFEFMRLTTAELLPPQLLIPGRSTHMDGSMFHTVEVPRTQRSAWLVYEREPFQGYEPLTLSNRDLTKFDATGMYTRATLPEIWELLRETGVI